MSEKTGKQAGEGSSGREVQQEVELASPIESVWRALTKSDELARWFPPEARVDPGEGGSVWMKWDESMQGEYPITAWEPEKHLRVGFPRVQAGELVTDYFLESKSGRTILRVVTSGFGHGDKWDDDFEAVSFGWRFQLASLRLYLEQHRGKPHRVIHIRRPTEESRALVWQRVVGPDGFLALRGTPLDGDAGQYLQASFAGDPPTPCRLLSWHPPAQVFGTLPELGDALFRVEHLIFRGAGLLIVWLATYGISDEVVTDLEAHWESAVDEALVR